MYQSYRAVRIAALGALIAATMAACGGGASAPAAATSAPAAATSAPAAATSAPAAATSAPAATTSAPVATAASGGGTASTDFSGSYQITGTNPSGTSYTGTLDVVKNGDVYGMTWQIGSDTQVGTGIASDTELAASFPSSNCAVGVYVEKSVAKTLDGVWAAPNGTTVNTETAVINNADQSQGILHFNLSGTNSDGSTYTGLMDLTVQGDVFRVGQKSGSLLLVGTGIEPANNLFVVSYGQQEGCAVVYYTLSGNTLTGKWGQLGLSDKLGSETATKP
jgi:hypothetical protein